MPRYAEGVVKLNAADISLYEPVHLHIASDGGKEGLGKEHIVPYSLGGRAVLPSSSCRRCEDVTKAFEQRCARTVYGSFKIRENVQTRNPRERPTHVDATALVGGITQIVAMPVAGAIATVPIVHFLPPGIFRVPPVKEVGWTGVTLEVKTDAPRDRSAWESSPAESFSFQQKYDVDALARTLAKIAHAIAVGELGIGAFEHWLPPYILGEDPTLSYLVGGGDGALAPSDRLHDIQWTVSPRNGDVKNYLVTVRIRTLLSIWRAACIGGCREKQFRVCTISPHQ